MGEGVARGGAGMEPTCSRGEGVVDLLEWGELWSMENSDGTGLDRNTMIKHAEGYVNHVFCMLQPMP